MPSSTESSTPWPTNSPAVAEQHDEWTEMRRYIGLDILAKSRQAKITDPNPTDPEVTIAAITA